MSAELAPVVSLAFVSGAMMYTSFRFAESEDVWIGIVSQLFHGFSVVLWLGVLYYGYDALPVDQSDVFGVFLAIAGLLLMVYAMFIVLRAVFGLIMAGYRAVYGFIKGSRERGFDDKSVLRGGRRG